MAVDPRVRKRERVKLVVVGAGGHARSVIEAVRAAGEHEAAACTEKRPELVGQELDGVPIVGDDLMLPNLLASGISGACLGVGGDADNGPRQRLFDHVREVGYELPAIVHPAAVVARSARLSHATVVLAHAVVGAGADVAENAVVNTAAVVEHDCVVEAYAHIATGALLAGGVTVGRLAHVGIGAAVINGVRIGERAIVGAGSAVIRDVAPDTTVAGCPAVPLAPGR